LEYELVEIGIETTLAALNSKSKNNSTARSGGNSASSANLPQQEK